MRCEDTRLSLKAKDCTVYQGFACQHTGIVEHVARGKGVSGIDDDIICLHQGQHICGRNPRHMGCHRD